MHNTDIKIMRIFNTYGPRMLPDDGRVVSTFICQALKSLPLTVFGDGSQTRSFCYVDDLIDGMIMLMNSNEKGPVNIGNPYEFKVIELANLIINKIDKNLKVINKPLPEDDPLQRKPNIDLACEKLGWSPKVLLNEGLDLTISYFKDNLN